MPTTLRLGFLPLIDAAPIIAAKDRGYFKDEGLNVSLHRQVGWANIRDKLSFGHIDVAHALLGMPLVSQLGRDSFTEPLVALMELGSGGNAVTVRRELFDAGVKSASDLLDVMKNYPGLGRLMIGHVFGSSMHHYLLREWLASGGLDPDRDVKLCVIPPPQMIDHMRGAYLDLFCVGEPWNTAAAREGVGVTLLMTTDILPRHPEKVLAVSRRFADQGGGIAGPMMEALVRAVLRGSQWCATSVANGGGALAELLARPEYVAVPRDIILASLIIDRDSGATRAQKNARPTEWLPRSFTPETSTFPNKMHAAWMLREMVRWGHLHPEADIHEIADRSCDSTAYRAAAGSLGIPCPPAGEDFIAMELRGGRMFRPEDLRHKLESRPSRSPARVA